MRLSSLLVAGACASSAAASAQTAIIRDDLPLPNDPSVTVTSIGGVATNQSGGYAVQVDVDDGTGSVDGAWGAYTNAPGALLRTEGTFAGYIQGSYETTIALSATDVVYSPSSVSVATGATGLDGMWVGDVPIAVEEEPFPMSSLFWRFASRPRTTEAGVPAFVGGLTDVQGGSTTERAFFLGTTPIYRTGDIVPGTTTPLSSTAVDFDSRVSANGTNNIALLDIDSTSTDDGVMAMNGMAMMLGGAIVQESFPIPASVGGLAGENWDNFDYFGITESGNYAFSGDTDGDILTDEFIVRDGVIILREGDVLDGETLDGSIELLYLSENNELAFVWDIDDATGTDLEALFFEGELLLAEGDAVDFDGDGMIDPGFVVTDFNSFETLAITSNGTVLVSADIDTNGTGTVEVVLAFEGNGAVGTNYCTSNPNSTGVAATIRAEGSNSAAANALTLIASDVPSGEFGIFLASQTQGNAPLFSGVLCLGGSIARFQQPGQVQVSDMNGEFSLTPDLTEVFEGPIPVAVMAGETWNFQGWYRDIDPMTGQTANLTDGLEVTFQ